MGSTRNERKRARPVADDNASADLEDRDNGAVKSSKKPRVEDRRSLFVRSLPDNATSESLTSFFSEYFPVKHATVVVDQKTKESRGFGFVTFADAEDAQAAKSTLDKFAWDGKRIRLEVAEPRQRNGTGDAPAVKSHKPEFQPLPKLIVRNLPWSIKTSDQLSHLFRSFGKVKFADLPQSRGKMKGFGFVTIRGKQNAERALQAINGKEVDGRTLAVDWAVDKNTWDQQNPDSKEDVEGDASAEQDESSEDEDMEDDDEDDEDEDLDADVSMGDDDAEVDGKTKNRDSELDKDLENFMKNHMQHLEEEDENEDNKDEEEDDNEANKPLPPPQRTTDNTSTVFIRNLPFTTTDEQLKGFFTHFGNVRYARVVMDKVTEKPAGTGFVCFFSADDAKSCIKGAPRPKQQPVTAAKSSILQDESLDPDGKYTLDGRLLQVTQAVNKAEAGNLASAAQAKRNEKDKRRLFLLPEGAIDRNSPLFSLLTPAEVQMRQASAAQRKKLIQGNPSLHLSLTRLALRNIPRNLTSTDLKELARKAVVGFAKDVREGRRQPLSKEENARDGDDARQKEHERKMKRKGIVRQAKIVYESSQGTKIAEKDGAGRSRGYGFIEYTSHHWALMGLRYLNGLQLENESGKKQRLIVEFAIENAQVVQRRRAAEEKSRQLNPQNKTQKPEEAAEKPVSGKDKGKDKGKARGKKGGKPADVEEDEEDNEGSGRAGDSKESMKQKLIGRKRLMRKKKAQIRGKK